MGEKIRVTVWLSHWEGLPELTEPARARAAEFNRAHPGYEVVVEGVDPRHAPTEVARAVAEDRAPHLVALQYFFTQEARDLRDRAGRPLFAAIERAVGGRTEILGEPVVLGDMIANGRNAYSFDGVQLATSRNPSTLLLFSNADMMAAAGVTAPPGTWRELEEACEAVSRLRTAPPHAATWPNVSWVFEQAVAQQGGLLVDHDNGRSGRARKVDLASPELLSYLDWWHGLHERGHYRYSGSPFGWLDANDAFAAQEVAFVLTSSVEAGLLAGEARAAGFELAVTPMPHNDKARYAGNPVASDAMWLADGLDPATSDGALAFLQYLDHPRTGNLLFGKDRCFIPVTDTAIGGLERDGWYERHPHFRAAIDQLRRTQDSPATRGAVFGNFRSVQGVIMRAMHDVLTSGAAPAQRFAEATAEAQRLLDEYNADFPD